MDISKREQTKASVAAFLAKHAGPGPHPSGSPQSVHGGPHTRFQVVDGDQVLSTHTHYGDAVAARQKITGHTRSDGPPSIRRIGTPEYEMTDLERQIRHLPPEEKK